MMEIREGLPDNAGLGKRRMKNGQRQVVNLQTLVFAEVPGQRAGSAAAGTVVPTASAGCGILMAGAYGNHARSAYNDQQKGEQHDAVAQCSNHGMRRILERSRESVKSKVADVGTMAS